LEEVVRRAVSGALEKRRPYVVSAEAVVPFDEAYFASLLESVGLSVESVARDAWKGVRVLLFACRDRETGYVFRVWFLGEDLGDSVKIFRVGTSSVTGDGRVPAVQAV